MAGNEQVNSLHPLLRKEFTFESFIWDECNAFAYQAALNVAQSRSLLCPVLLYGESGVGKTHLAQAIEIYLYEQNSEAEIHYISATDFCDEFYASIESHETDSFKSWYENLDILIIDDIHFLQGKAETQKVLLAIFKTLKEKNKKIICKSGYKLKNTNSQFVEFLRSGLCIDLVPPKVGAGKNPVAGKKMALEAGGMSIVYVFTECKFWIEKISGEEIDGELLKNYGYTSKRSPSLYLVEIDGELLNYRYDKKNNRIVYTKSDGSENFIEVSKLKEIE